MKRTNTLKGMKMARKEGRKDCGKGGRKEEGRIVGRKEDYMKEGKD
jgi:hypothetical protein